MNMDHEYVPTIAGLCLRCRYPAVAHAPQYRSAMAVVPERPPVPTAQDACPVNHSQVTVKLLIGDEGQVWTRCPHCGVILEPAIARHEYGGKPYGIGRGEASPRFLARVAAYVGWFRHQFGNEP